MTARPISVLSLWLLRGNGAQPAFTEDGGKNERRHYLPRPDAPKKTLSFGVRLKTSQPPQPRLCSRERLDEALDWRGLQTTAAGEPRRLQKSSGDGPCRRHITPPPPPAPPSSRTTPAARPLSSDELSQRPETQDGHCRDAAAAGRRPGRGHSGKGRPRPSGHGKHQRRLADRCLSRGVVATSTRSSSTRSTTSRVHVPQHGSPSGCRR